MALTPKLMDEVERLFDELVSFPWRRTTARPVAPKPGKTGDGWHVEVPLRAGEYGDVEVDVEGTRLTVTVTRRSAAHIQRDNVEATASGRESLRQSFEIPAGSRLNGVAVTFAPGVVRVHVRLEPAGVGEPRPAAKEST